MSQSYGWRTALFFCGDSGSVVGIECDARLPELRRDRGRSTCTCISWRGCQLTAQCRWLAGSATSPGTARSRGGPDLIQEQKGFTAREAGLALGLTVVLGGALGIAVGVYVSDRIARRRLWGHSLIIPIGFALGAPAILIALHTAGKIPFLFFS
jgi:hypothetical protein